VVQGSAEALPFPDASFDAATAFITIHHWSDWRRGLAEMQRVARRILVLGIDVHVLDRTWLIQEYFSFLIETSPIELTVHDVVAALGARATVTTIPTPHDCVDGFFAAYWRRPEAYLDASVRACISGLARAEPATLDPIVVRLAADLQSGDWHRRHQDLLDLETYDTGMRLITWE
jgi:SAM-dependent methyltransferase